MTAVLLLWLQASAPASGRTIWIPAAPIGSRVDGDDRLRGPERRFVTMPFADGKLRFRRLHWSGWDSKRAIGKGEGRLCASGACDGWHGVTFVLSRRQAFGCGEVASGRWYTRFRVRGFDPVYNGRFRSGDQPC